MPLYQWGDQHSWSLNHGNLTKKKRLFSYGRSQGQSCGRMHCSSLRLGYSAATRCRMCSCLPVLFQPLPLGSVWRPITLEKSRQLGCHWHKMQLPSNELHLSHKDLLLPHHVRAQSRCTSQVSVHYPDIKGLWVFRIRCYLKLGLNRFPNSEARTRNLVSWCLVREFYYVR